MTETPGWSSPQPPREPDRDRAPAGGEPPTGPTGWSVEQPPPGPPPPGGWQRPGWGGPSPPGPGPGGWRGPPPAAKPGIIPLRPLGLGEILDGAISTIRSHPKVTLGLAALVAAISQLLQLLITVVALGNLEDAAADLDETATLADVADALAGPLAGAGLAAIVTFIAGRILTGMLTVVVSRAVLGQGVSIGSAWRQAAPQFLRLIGVTLLIGLAIVGGIVLCVVPGTVLALAGAPGALVALLLVLGALAAVVVSVYLYTTLALATPALVLEKQGVMRALTRSRRLVKGGFWRVFGILVLAAIIASLISGIIQLPFSVLSTGGQAVFGDLDSGDPSLAALLVAALGGVVAGAITYPFSAGVGALLYVDQRMRREGLDLELARAAGVPTSGAPAPGGPPATPSYGDPPPRRW